MQYFQYRPVVRGGSRGGAQGARAPPEPLKATYPVLRFDLRILEYVKYVLLLTWLPSLNSSRTVKH
jgi:hypothetical protein